MVSKADGKLVIPAWVDNDVVKPIIDDNGRIKVTVGEATITIDVNIESTDITLPVEEQSPLTSIQAQDYGWDGSNWRKLPMVWGFSDTVRQYAEATAAGASTITGLCTTPPAGQVYVYQGFNAMHNDTVARTLTIGVYNGVSYYGAISYPSATSGVWYGDPLEVVVKNGEQFFVRAYIGTAGKMIYMYAMGYAMKVSE